MELIEGLKEASESEVTTWFEAHPEYKEILHEDMCANLDVYYDEEFEDILSHTKFQIHPIVGLIPLYALENLGEVAFEIGAEPDDFYRIIRKSLWFCVIEKTDYGQESLCFEPLNNFERIQFECEMELQKYWDDIETYLYQWKTLDFSNGGRFVPAKEVIGVDFEELIESEKVFDYASPSGLSDFEHSARVLQDDNGRIFVHISAYGDYLMEVSSNKEAKKILDEIWG